MPKAKPRRKPQKPQSNLVKPNPPSDAGRTNDKSLITGYRSESFAGPIPHPDHLERYKEIYPQAPEIVFRMAEQQSQHRQAMEKKMLKSDLRRSWSGVLAGFVIAIVGLAVAGWTSVKGQPVAGTVIGTVDLAGLVYVFVRGQNLQTEDLRRAREQ